MTSRAHVSTDKAVAYMGRLCRHFAYWHEASAEERHGSIRFQHGRCELVAGPDLLTLVVRAEGSARLRRLQEVLTENLVDLSEDSELRVEWEPRQG